MKAYIIQSGRFSKAGNFIAFSTKGERIHIYKKDILRLFTKAGIVYRCQGTYENELITFPFYCIAEHLTFDNPDGTTFTRLTASEIHSSDYAIKAKTELQSTIDYYEEQLKYYTFEAADRGRRLDSYREAYDKLAEEHDALVAKVEHFDAEGEIGDYIRIAENLKDQVEELQRENDGLRGECNALQWDYEYAQSERERLALIIVNTRETLMSCNLGLSEDKINQLINNA